MTQQYYYESLASFSSVGCWGEYGTQGSGSEDVEARLLELAATACVLNPIPRPLAQGLVEPRIGASEAPFRTFGFRVWG